MYNDIHIMNGMIPSMYTSGTVPWFISPKYRRGKWSILGYY